MRTLVIASGKGGVGKTVIAANLAIALSQMDRDVLIVDADIAMANLDIVLGLREYNTTLLDVLAGKASILDAIHRGPAGVRVVPAGQSLDGFRETRLNRLEEALSELPPTFDFVIIDAPAGRESALVLGEGQELILVATPDVPSVADALRTLEVGRELGASPLGVVMNKVTGSKKELRREEIEATLNVPVLCMVPYDPKIHESVLDEYPFVLRYPKRKASKEIFKMAAILTGDRRYLSGGFISKISRIILGR